MIGVQSCKHFGCQRSHPTILGFGHPSGALEDGAREKFLVPGTIFSCGALKQWKCTDYDPMWSLCILSRVKCESFSLLAGQKKVVQFCSEGRILSGGQIFFTVNPIWILCIVESTVRVSAFYLVKQKSCPDLKLGTNFFR